MSDQYRPPAGPKGQRSAPQGPKGNWKSGNLQYGGQSSKRYKDRDNNKFRGSEYDEDSRPAGPSGYREKRPYPERSQESNKRRDYDTGSKRDFRNVRDSRDPRDSKDSKDIRDSRNFRDNRDPRDSRDNRDVRDSRDMRDSRDSRDARGSRGIRDPRDTRDSRGARDLRDSRGPRDVRDSRDPRQRRDTRDARSSRDSRDPRDSKNLRDLRDPRDPRDRGKNDRDDDTPKKARNKKKTRSKPPRLQPSQIYLLHTIRSSEVYQRIQQVGEGTYGKVYKARHDITGEYVALKKLRLESEREGFPITAMREIKLLQSFDHPNVVGLLEMMVEQNQIYMVLDYLDHDLTGLLTHPDLKLTEGHRKTIFKQLMQGLSYLHKRRVIHRDIKGSNILLNSKGVLKITDFGLARTMKVLAAGDKPDYTNRVITIWYRPPELLLGSTDYGREVDIWGVGCLLMELYTRTATFQGTEEISQLFKIFDVMGTPTLESWPDIENMPWFEMLKPRVNRKSRFEADFKPVMGEHAFDLAQKLLEVVPAKRYTADQALEHHYFTSDPQPEPLTFMETLEGEWHEFETKKRRREERKRLQSLRSLRAREPSAPPSQPRNSILTPEVNTDEKDKAQEKLEKLEETSKKQEVKEKAEEKVEGVQGKVGEVEEKVGGEKVDGENTKGADAAKAVVSIDQNENMAIDVDMHQA